MRCSPPSSAAGAGKNGEYVTCLICHQKVSFNKYSWTTPRQHMRKHNIHSPSNLETVVQLAKQCWKEGWDFRRKGFPFPRLSTRRGDHERGRLQTTRSEGASVRTQRDNGIQPGAKGCELVDRDGLPPLCHYQHACISSHVMCVGPVSPGSRPKECDESSMHAHLLSVAFHVHSVSPYFLVPNVVGAAVQITRLYNSGVEQLKNEEDWPCVRPAFICNLWKSVTNKEYFTYTAHWVRDKVGWGAGVETMSGDNLRVAGGDNIHSR